MSKPVVSERESGLPVTTIVELLKIAEERKDIISLGPGEPDFTAPKNIIRAAKKYLDRGYTHYSPSGGRTEFKEEIIKKLKRENGIRAGDENIIVTCGSTEAILLSLMCLIDPGEGVLIPDPGFLAYRPTVELLNGMPISIPLREEDGFQFSLERARDVIVKEKTNVIIVNTPSNPTGCVFTKKCLREVADFAIENDLIILSDEAYEKFVYGDSKHISIGSLNGMEDRVVSLFSFSKSYAMPGFRVGIAAGPEKIIKAMTKIHPYSTLCAPTISQVTAMEALKGPQGAVEGMVREYDRRRRFVIKRLYGLGLPFVEPNGAFYIFPNIRGFGMNSLKFSKFLLEKAKVAVVPGTEFGRYGEGYIRISYATDYKKIGIAMDRIERVVKKL